MYDKINIHEDKSDKIIYCNTLDIDNNHVDICNDNYKEDKIT